MKTIKLKVTDLRLSMEEISNAKTEFVTIEISPGGGELFLYFETCDKIRKRIKLWGNDSNVTPEISETKKLYRKS